LNNHHSIDFNSKTKKEDRTTKDLFNGYINEKQIFYLKKKKYIKKKSFEINSE